jgi:hypothetical protein
MEKSTEENCPKGRKSSIEIRRTLDGDHSVSWAFESGLSGIPGFSELSGRCGANSWAPHFIFENNAG